MNQLDFNRLEKQIITRCPCCDTVAEVVFDLPGYPLTEFYKELSDNSQPYGFIDQSVLFCEICNHLFLGKILDAQQIYSHYLTSTISSRGAVVCLENFVKFLERSAGSVTQTTIIDIGGNDSTFLEYFVGRTLNLINIDANATSKNSLIQLRKSFLEDVNFEEFDSDTPKIFASSHTIEHLEQPVVLLEKLSKAIRDQDQLYLQFPSVELLVQQRRFDQICHQHLNYFSLTSIDKILRRFGLYINSYEFDSTHFGTLRLKASRSKCKDVFSRRLSSKDVRNAFVSFQTYYASLNMLLEQPFEQGQGFGAALMVPTLAYYLPLIDQLSKIVDENPLRIGKRFINLQPQILGLSELERDKPVLVTAISTKDATRAIFTKLMAMGIRDICIPSVVI
ncbi:MAG: class I SAM-dependent methyltransferase [Magnetococcales bacterium]|nr:class I SAM-dependent methyltransferase [Magnetococcales bacterium]